MLNILNDKLYNENKSVVSKYKDEKFPIYIILAHPRGASTLFVQLLLSNLEIGYINNFLAKFYKAPIFGLELEQDVLDTTYKSNFSSKYGNTNGINEPHEWGWFWKNQLQLSNGEFHTKLTEFKDLKNNLLAITNYRKLPLIIDNVYAASNVLKFKKEFKNIRVINLTRDLYFISNSFLNASISRYGNIETLYGNFEKDNNIFNPIEQVVNRVKIIQDEIDEVLDGFNKEYILNIDYEDMYHNTYDVVEKFHAFAKKDNIDLKYKEKHLPKLEYRNDISLVNSEYKNDLDFYYKMYFS